jgi:hypothetical protein
MPLKILPRLEKLVPKPFPENNPLDLRLPLWKPVFVRRSWVATALSP